MKDVTFQLLVSARQQVEALGSQLDAALAMLAGQDEETCLHPSEKRKQLGMGGKAWQCECGHIGGDE